jgi:hypothetical protein
MCGNAATGNNNGLHLFDLIRAAIPATTVEILSANTP